MGPCMVRSTGYTGNPLIKVLLEPSVQAAGEDHPTDLSGGERAESHENPIGFWVDAVGVGSCSHWRGLESYTPQTLPTWKGLHFSQDPQVDVG